MRHRAPSRSAAGLLAVATIGLSTAFVTVPAVAQAAPSGWSFSSATGTPVTVPAGTCAIDWAVVGSRGGADADGRPSSPPLGSRYRSVVTQGETFTLSVGTPGAAAADGGAGGTNAAGGGAWDGGDATDGASGGGGAASVVLRNGSLYLAGLGGPGAGTGGGSHGSAGATGSAVLVPLGLGEERLVSLPDGESQGYVSGSGIACGTFTNTNVPTPFMTSVSAGPGQLTGWFDAGAPEAQLPAGTSWDYSLDGTTWQPANASTVLYPTGVSRRFTVSGLTNGQQYTVRLRATSSLGLSEVRTAPYAVTPFVMPGKPTAVAVRADTSALTLTWSPPTETGTFPLGGYEVTVIEADATEDDPGPQWGCETDAAARGCVIGVPAGGEYLAYVSAFTSSRLRGESVVVRSGQVPLPVVPQSVPEGDDDLTGAGGSPITTVTAGGTVVLRGSGFAANSSVRAIAYSEPTVIDTFVTDGNGDFEVTVTIPAGLPAGQHSLVVTGVDPDGVVRNLRVDVTVAASGAAPVVTHAELTGDQVAATTGDPAGGTTGAALASTGASVVGPAVGGLAAIAVGSGLFVLSRRRTRAATD